MCSCPPTRGEMINRRARLGSEMLRLREQIPVLEKLSRKTPPRTLPAERERVERAKGALEVARKLLAATVSEYALLLATEQKGSVDE
jgi:hypothetical protein